MDQDSQGTQRRPTQKRAELTRQKILEAGERLISQDGYHNTSSKKIAKAAGVSVGTFYNHFRDKKDLLLTIYLDHSRQVHSLIFGELASGGFASGAPEGKGLVRALIEHTLKLHTLSPSFHRQMIVMQYSDDEVAALVEQKEQQAVQMVVELLSSNAPALRVDDLQAAVRVVVQAVEEVVHSIIIKQSPIEPTRITDALADMVHRFLYE